MFVFVECIWELLRISIGNQLRFVFEILAGEIDGGERFEFVNVSVDVVLFPGAGMHPSE